MDTYVSAVCICGVAFFVYILLCKSFRREKENAELSIIPNRKKYENMLRIQLNEEAEPITFVRYSNTVHDIDSFIENCEQIKKEKYGITIDNLTTMTFIPWQAIQTVAIINTSLPDTNNTEEEVSQ